MISATHEMKLAADMAANVIFMANGKIFEEGILRDIFQSSKEERTRIFCAAFYHKWNTIFELLQHCGAGGNVN